MLLTLSLPLVVHLYLHMGLMTDNRMHEDNKLVATIIGNLTLSAAYAHVHDFLDGVCTPTFMA